MGAVQDRERGKGIKGGREGKRRTPRRRWHHELRHFTEKWLHLGSVQGTNYKHLSIAEGPSAKKVIVGEACKGAHWHG